MNIIKEKRCDDIEKKIENKFVEVEDKLETKCTKNEVEKIIEDKIKTLPMNNGGDEMKKMVQTTVTNIVDTKIAESEKEMGDRQSREKNFILFKAAEPKTNIIDERVAADKELIGKIITEMNFETRENFEISKVIRLGIKKQDPQENPRPLLVTLSTFEAKKAFLKHASKVKNSSDESLKNLTIQNDMTKRDREREYDLVQEKFAKNSEIEGNWRYVIRGPPGERTLVKIKITQ